MRCHSDSIAALAQLLLNALEVVLGVCYSFVDFW
jgi:hypothetical protein